MIGRTPVPRVAQPVRPTYVAAPGVLTMSAFEARVSAEPDLVMSPIYWNCIVPEMTPGYVSWLVLMALDDYKRWLAEKDGGES